MAKRLRDIIADVIPDEVEDFAIILNEVRNSIKGNLSEKIEILNRVTEVLVNKGNYQEELNSTEFEKINLN